jgi:drug/metabolite transporter (DMT)-like permease
MASSGVDVSGSAGGAADHSFEVHDGAESDEHALLAGGDGRSGGQDVVDTAALVAVGFVTPTAAAVGMDDGGAPAAGDGAVSRSTSLAAPAMVVAAAAVASASAAATVPTAGAADVPAGSSSSASASATAASAQQAAVGMALVLSSTLAFSVMSLGVNVLGGAVPSLQTNWIRFVLQAVLTVVSIAIRNARAPAALRAEATWLGPRAQWPRLARRGLWGIGGMGSFFYVLTSAPLADATALAFVNVPLTAIFARAVLKEPYTVWDAGAGAACMVGVLFIAQPPALFGGTAGAVSVDPFVVAVALFGATCSAMAYITIRSIGPGVDPLVVVLWFSIVGATASPVLAATLQGFVDVSALPAADVALLFGIGFAGWVGQVLLNAGVARSPAGPATLMRYADMVFAVVFQAALLGDPPGPLKLVGVALILSCTVAALQKARKKKGAPAAAPAAAAVAAAAAAAAAAATAAEQAAAAKAPAAKPSLDGADSGATVVEEKGGDGERSPGGGVVWTDRR